MQSEIEQIHDFWFGPLDEQGMAAPQKNSLWFTASEETDQALADQFGPLVASAVAGELASWADNDRGLIALILLLDQFTRNIYRGTPAAFSGDEQALGLAQHCIAHGHHQRLPAIYQVFLYLPLEHSEDLDVQNECVELFDELGKVTGLAQIADFGRYALAHREVIERFGRFPHRNNILGRDSTDEELKYLESHGGF